MTFERVLDAYLDAVVSNTPAQPDTLDQATLDTVERLFAADDVPGLPAKDEERIWREVLQSIDAVAQRTPGPLLPMKQDHGGLRGQPPRRSRVSPPGVQLHLAPLATAALVLLMLLGSLAVLHGPSLPRPEEPITISVGEPGRSLTTLALTQVAELPEPGPLLRVTLRRETYDPGAKEEFGTPETTGDALDFVMVEAGVLTMEADGPLTVWHSAAGHPEPTTVGAGTTIQLQPGDQALSPSGVTVRRRNMGSGTAVILSVLITQHEMLTFPPGVTNVRLVPDLVLSQPWPAPATLSLRRAQLPSGSQFPLEELPGLQLLYVEAGTLDLMGAWRRGDLAPVRWDAIPAGQGAAYFETTTAVANSGDAPATFLVVTVESAG